MDKLENTVNASSFAGLTGRMPVIDVRTPSEFSHGHIPGAYNIPIFSDEERVIVGTTYKREGREPAVIKGLDFIGHRMSAVLREALSIAGNNRMLAVYCWRGGMRSESMAWLFRQGGISTCRLEGGYKAYRSYITGRLASMGNVIIVGGLTGSGKTRILSEMSSMGEQVIDLEGLANHRGSAFGSLGMPAQPTSEHFLNLLYNEFARLDHSKRIFLEDESKNIGSVFMPDEIYNVIRSSPLVAVMTDVETRMPRLMEEYGQFDPDLLKESINRISKRLGGDNTKLALESVERGDIGKAIEIVLVYYDKSYRYGLSRRDPSTVTTVETFTADARENAARVIEAANRIGGGK